MSAPLGRWLDERLDQVPAEFRPFLAPAGAPDPEGPVADALLGRAFRALADAMARPGRDREAAFRLLAADAYLTYACEAALEDPEPEEALRALMGRIGPDVE